MSTREEELDQLERRLRENIERPYIERPDERDVGVGGACFLDRDRLCGPDCTSFVDPEAPTAAERCVILSGVNTGLELLAELVQLKRHPLREVPAAPSIPPPYANMRKP